MAECAPDLPCAFPYISFPFLPYGTVPTRQGDPAKLAEIERIEALCAEKLGVWTRQYTYQQLLQNKALASHALCQVRDGIRAYK